MLRRGCLLSTQSLRASPLSITCPGYVSRNFSNKAGFPLSEEEFADLDPYQKSGRKLERYKTVMDSQLKYKGWSNGLLLARIQELEDAVADRKKNGTQKERQNGTIPQPQENVASSSSSATAATPQEAEAEQSSGSSPAEANSNRKPRIPAPRTRQPRVFNVADLPVRKIALRFAYDGENYSGLAAQGDGIPGSESTLRATNLLPTVEQLLWNALCMARLVDPTKGINGSGWSRCGRTDRGVSAAGQVVALWVRSTKVDERGIKKQEEDRLQQRFEAGKMRYGRAGFCLDDDGEEVTEALAQASLQESAEDGPSDADTLLPGVSPDALELPYVTALNRLLPHTIRVTGWSPVRPSFNARFDCRYRHYKYFFTSGPPEHLLPPRSHAYARRMAACRMDIDKMREAASYLLGDHDFRNLCKVDASKQIKNFRRRVDGVSIDRVEPGWPSKEEEQSSRKPHPAVRESTKPAGEDMYVLNLRGTAFLYHQVRHIMAVLLLVGAGMEKPTIMKELLNVEKGALKKDRVWLKAAGVTHDGELILPDSTATELDGATAMSTNPELAWHTMLTKSNDGEVGSSSVYNAEDQEVNSDGEDSQFIVYDRKPEYELSADRPLVLWECGFRPGDVSWRAGAYDGPLSSLPKPVESDMVVTASNISGDLYRTWCKTAISSEIARHFVLSAPSPSKGTLPSGTLFEEARWPALTVDQASMDNPAPDSSAIPLTVPFGNGHFRPVQNWRGLYHRKREESVEWKNQSYREGKGKRKLQAKKQQGQPQQQQQPQPQQVVDDGVEEEESVSETKVV